MAEAPSDITSLHTTPDVRLLRLREHCQRIVASAAQVSTAALMAAQMFLALDAGLSDDGVLPLDWSGSRKSFVLNGMPKQPSFTGFVVPDLATDPDEDPNDVIEV